MYTHLSGHCLMIATVLISSTTQDEHSAEVACVVKFTEGIELKKKLNTAGVHVKMNNTSLSSCKLACIRESRCFAVDYVNSSVDPCWLRGKKTSGTVVPELLPGTWHYHIKKRCLRYDCPHFITHVGRLKTGYHTMYHTHYPQDCADACMLNLNCAGVDVVPRSYDNCRNYTLDGYDTIPLQESLHDGDEHYTFASKCERQKVVHMIHVSFEDDNGTRTGANSSSEGNDTDELAHSHVVMWLSLIAIFVFILGVIATVIVVLFAKREKADRLRRVKESKVYPDAHRHVCPASETYD